MYQISSWKQSTSISNEKKSPDALKSIAVQQPFHRSATRIKCYTSRNTKKCEVSKKKYVVSLHPTQQELMHVLNNFWNYCRARQTCWIYKARRNSLPSWFTSNVFSTPTPQRHSLLMQFLLLCFTNEAYKTLSWSASLEVNEGFLKLFSRDPYRCLHLLAQMWNNVWEFVVRVGDTRHTP